MNVLELFLVRMDFSTSESLRQKIIQQTETLKQFKVQKRSKQFSELLKTHTDTFEELFEELEQLKEQFKIFKLNTLSTVQVTELTSGTQNVITTPFEIYVAQR